MVAFAYPGIDQSVSRRVYPPTGQAYQRTVRNILVFILQIRMTYPLSEPEKLDDSANVRARNRLDFVASPRLWAIL